MNVLISAYACEPFRGSEPGQGWNWVLHLSKYINVFVITRSNNQSVIESYKMPKENNIHFFYFDIEPLAKWKKKIPFGQYLYYTFWLFFSKKKIKKIISEYNIQIFHHLTFNSFQLNQFIGAETVKEIRGPIGGAMYAKTSLFYKIGVKYYIFETFRNIITWFGLKYQNMGTSLRKFDLVLFANNTSKVLLRKVNKNTSILFDSGVNNELIKSPEKKKFSNGELKLLFVGNLLPRKGVMLLLDVMSELKNYNINLSIIGDGPLINKVRSVIEKKKLNNINLYGHIPYVEIQKIYESHEVFIFPSYRDTGGNVLLEAMSKKLPIICIDHQGAADIVPDKGAIKLKLNNYTELKQSFLNAILSFMNNPNKRHEMGESLNQHLIDNYLWDTRAKKLITQYRSLL